MAIDGGDHGGAEEEELDVLGRRVARVEQVRPGVGAHRPVVVLARAVDAGERLLVHEADKAVAAGHVLEDLHGQLLVVGADVGVLEDRGQLVLGRCDLVVARLDRNAEALQLLLGLEHAGQDPFGDRAEVVLVELVPLGGLAPEERAAGRIEVRALVEVLLVDQEVLLLGADGGEHAGDLVVTEGTQRPGGRLGESVHRAQQRDLVVQGLAGPRDERGGNAENGAVGVVQHEGRGARVPGGVAASLEGCPQPAGGEGGGVRLALDELLAGELGNRGPVAARFEEGVVLLGGQPGKRLEPVRVVGSALLHRPLAHPLGDGVGQLRVEGLALLEGLLEAGERGLGEALGLDGGAEDVDPVEAGVGGGECPVLDGASVGGPLGGKDVVLAGLGGHLLGFLLGAVWVGKASKKLRRRPWADLIHPYKAPPRAIARV